jgi:hypothetical protein
LGDRKTLGKQLAQSRAKPMHSHAKFKIPTLVGVISLLSFACSDSPISTTERLGTKQSAVCNPAIALCGDPLPPPVIGPSTPPTVTQIAASYANYDFDGDGNAEISSLIPLPFEPQTPPTSTDGKVVLVLVENRLIGSGKELSALSTRLQQHRTDLLNEGFDPHYLSADVYHGVIHQDGKTLLAMRRFVKEVRAIYKQLAGVVLVGSFPEATLFRRVLFRSGDNMYLHPERINPRTDLVLGDLDGNWEELYHQQETLEHLVMTVTNTPSPPGWPIGCQTLRGPIVYQHEFTWEDFFYIRDEQTRRTGPLGPPGTETSVYVERSDPRNPEMTDDDKMLPNPVARPEIVVSRIDAKHVAWNPTAPPDRFGNGPFDSAGRPQTLEYLVPNGGAAPSISWVQDPALEKRLLSDYFDRNHSFRIAADQSLPFRVSSIRGPDPGLPGPGPTNTWLQGAHPSLGAQPGLESDLATLDQYLEWLRQPAVLRGVEAHAHSLSTAFGAANDPAALVALLGPTYNWGTHVISGGGVVQLVPTNAGYTNGADWQFMRSVFESHVLDGTGERFFMHLGCSVLVPDTISSDHDTGVSYDDADYAKQNNGESILFFTKGLGVVSRAKVFNDRPEGFPAGIASDGIFGTGWPHSFTTDGANAALKPGTGTSVADGRILNNKRTYFWGMLGDWTLRLRYTNTEHVDPKDPPPDRVK